MEHAPIVPRRTSLYPIEKETGNFSTQFFSQDTDEANSDFNTYFNVMRRRKWFVITPLIIVLPLVIIGLLQQKPIYEATVTLLIDSGSSKIVNIEDVLQADRSREYYETQLKLIMSPVLTERVIDILGVQKENLIPESQSEPNSSIIAVSNFPRKVLRLIKAKIGGQKYDSTLNPAEVARHEKIVAFQKALKVEPVLGT